MLDDNSSALLKYAGENNKSTFFKWLKSTAKSYFQKIKKQKVIESREISPIYLEDMCESTKKRKRMDKEINIAALLDSIELERDRLVLEKIDIEGVSYDELASLTGITKANLYNIRKRALERLKKKARIALREADASYAIRCEQYILDMFGIHKSMAELKRIAEEKGWLTDSGVAIENLGKLTMQFGLSVRTGKSDITKIVSAIDSGKQIIAAVDGGELIGNPFEEKLEDVLVGGIADHCVVVLYYDKEEDNVILFNPAFGDIPLTVSSKTFVDAWEDSGYYTIEIGETKNS